MNRTRMRSSRLSVAISLTVTLFAPATLALAGVVTDGSMGRGGTLSGPNFAIPADLGRQQGGNLFHSFSEFNLVRNDIATFSGPASVNNIISRVTGGTASSIDGTIRSTIAGANLYFINPHGIMFGPNARLDVTGSFHATTADYLKLGTEGRFDARIAEDSLLTSAPPSAFGFVTAKPAAISFDGTFLQTVEGKNLVVAGGDISLSNTNLYAPAGNIGILSVASAGEADIAAGSIPGDNFSILGKLSLIESRAVEDIPAYPFASDRTIGNIDSSGASRSGNITLHSGDALLSNAQICSRNFGAEQGGFIRIVAARDLDLESSSVIRNNSLGFGAAGDLFIEAAKISIMDYSVVMSSPYASGNGGNLFVKAADSLTLASGGIIETSAREGAGNAGNAIISAAKINIDGSYSGISSSTLTAGNGGVLDIQATDSLILTDGGSINVTAAAGSAGNAGSATIKTASLTMDGGFISGAARSSGKGGILDIYASDSIKLSNWSFVYVDTSESGDAGTLTINTPRLNVDGRSSISSETLSSGRGGDLFIKATDSIDLNNSGYISVSTFGTGDAGTADIKTGKLNIDGGFIAGSTYAASGRGGDIIINAADSINLTNAGSISVDTSNAGDSGIVSINTGALSIDNYSYISGTTWSSGKGGKLNISASDSITIANFGEISVKTGSTGAAGTAVIDTAKLNIDNGGISGATVSFGKGGGVEINASDSIKVTNQGYISVSALAGSGDAGDISINTNRLSVDELGYITGSTATSGKGGNLVINATDSISLTNSGSIFVDTHAAGDSGAVAIQTGRLHINGFLSYISGTTWSSGKGGKVNISANTIELSDLAVITSGSNGTGAAGDLIITAAGLVKLNNGSITTATADADGGNIAIHPGAIDLYNGRISTSVAGGTGNGGNIDLAAKALVLDNSSIIANAEGGNGGNINLSTGALIKSRSGGVISASSRLGLEGTIFISAPLIDLGGALADMPDTILDLDALLPKRCASGDEGISSFTILEQAAVPANPDRPLATP